MLTCPLHALRSVAMFIDDGFTYHQCSVEYSLPHFSKIACFLPSPVACDSHSDNRHGEQFTASLQITRKPAGLAPSASKTAVGCHPPHLTGYRCSCRIAPDVGVSLAIGLTVISIDDAF
ncbi:jg27305 [Pararge aegeria aegeria]|uniref:Jg27305 protein n=1 Tax=Pararge aegeria aegeria TaxID=348720 RepID=A0A8S4SQM1_9NEOP|nr:jg27305 [Pararge aegeria aegeria]